MRVENNRFGNTIELQVLPKSIHVSLVNNLSVLFCREGLKTTTPDFAVPETATVAARGSYRFLTR